MNYPDPQHNSLCQCKDNPLRAFWCITGHMTECHYPHRCSEAACSHLHNYDFSQDEIEVLEADARAAIELGLRRPYELADKNNVTVDQKATSITCPRCGMTRYNLNDVEQRYCGNCHMFHADMNLGTGDRP